jgi:hypothetical protein
MVGRYKGQVPEWEIWNEPDINKQHTGREIGEFYLRTAKIVKEVQPNARLIALGMASVTRLDFVRDFMEYLKENDGLKYIDIFTYHGYAPNPDTSYPQIEKMRELVWSYNPNIVFMQGENGAPSQPKGTTVGAMTNLDWSELGDHGRGIATNLFTISDIHYEAGDHMVGINTKGLLKTNPDKTIERPKLSYKAAQHVFSLFDNQLKLADKRPQTDVVSVYAFQYSHTKNNGSLITLWSGEDRPAESYEPKQTTVTMEGTFKNPVYVDLISGKVYEIPKSQWKKTGKGFTFTGIPVPDYPVLIAEKVVVLR